MSNANNVFSFSDAVSDSIERTILDNLQNRGGRWVAEPFLVSIAMTPANKNVPVMPVINKMVNDGALEKQFVPIQDKSSRTIQAAMYRLVLNF